MALLGKTKVRAATSFSHVCLTVLVLLIHLSKLSLNAVIFFEKCVTIILIMNAELDRVRVMSLGKTRPRQTSESADFEQQVFRFQNRPVLLQCDSFVVVRHLVTGSRAIKIRKDVKNLTRHSYLHLHIARRSRVTVEMDALYKRPLPVEHLPCTQHSHCTNIRHLFNIRFVQTAATCSIFASYKPPSPVQYLPCVQHWHCTNSKHLSNICLIANLR